jgi:hypothetical protein
VGGDGGVEDYERLRARALAGDAAGWRLGLAVLEARGVAAWLHVRRGVPAAAPTQPEPVRSAAPLPAGAAADLVRVLASMALHAVAGG